MNNFKLIILDCDGVLVASKRLVNKIMHHLARQIGRFVQTDTQQ